MRDNVTQELEEALGHARRALDQAAGAAEACKEVLRGLEGEKSRAASQVKAYFDALRRTLDEREARLLSAVEHTAEVAGGTVREKMKRVEEAAEEVGREVSHVEGALVGGACEGVEAARRCKSAAERCGAMCGEKAGHVPHVEVLGLDSNVGAAVELVGQVVLQGKQNAPKPEALMRRGEARRAPLFSWRGGPLVEVSRGGDTVTKTGGGKDEWNAWAASSVVLEAGTGAEPKVLYVEVVVEDLVRRAEGGLFIGVGPDGLDGSGIGECVGVYTDEAQGIVPPLPRGALHLRNGDRVGLEVVLAPAATSPKSPGAAALCASSVTVYHNRAVVGTGPLRCAQARVYVFFVWAGARVSLAFPSAPDSRVLE